MESFRSPGVSKKSAEKPPSNEGGFLQIGITKLLSNELPMKFSQYIIFP